MAISRRGRRAGLLGVAALLVAGNIWWFTRSEPAPAPDFELGKVADEALTLSASAAAHLPRFDVDRGEWRVDGQVVANLRELGVLRPVDAKGAEPLHRFLAVNLPQAASPGDMRRMLLSLARSGICGVAVHQDADPADENGDFRVPVHRIVSVRADDGARVACEERS